MPVQVCECAGLHVHMSLSGNYFWLPQCKCKCVGMLLLCMLTQFQGCGWAQGVLWLSLLIICRSVRQLSREHRMSNEEMERVLLLSDRLSDCTLLGTLLSSWGAWPSSSIWKLKNNAAQLQCTSTCPHFHRHMQIDIPADSGVLEYIHLNGFV